MEGYVMRIKSRIIFLEYGLSCTDFDSLTSSLAVLGLKESKFKKYLSNKILSNRLNGYICKFRVLPKISEDGMFYPCPCIQMFLDVGKNESEFVEEAEKKLLEMFSDGNLFVNSGWCTNESLMADIVKSAVYEGSDEDVYSAVNQHIAKHRTLTRAGCFSMKLLNSGNKKAYSKPSRDGSKE